MNKILLICLVAATTAKAFAMHVIVDPGHGGNDHGAKFKNISEASITLNVAQNLERLLQADPDFKVTLTRSSDTYVSLESRANQAIAVKGDVFLSIHVNSSKDPRAQGKEIYFQNQLPPDEESLFLANMENKGAQASKDESLESGAPDIAAIVADLKRNHRIYQSGKLSEFLHFNWIAPSAHRSRPIRQAPFHVISRVTMPSALVEIGYLTHAEEGKRLLDPKHIKEIAQGLYVSLKDFKEFVDKKSLPHLN